LIKSSANTVLAIDYKESYKHFVGRNSIRFTDGEYHVRCIIEVLSDYSDIATRVEAFSNDMLLYDKPYNKWIITWYSSRGEQDRAWRSAYYRYLSIAFLANIRAFLIDFLERTWSEDFNIWKNFIAPGRIILFDKMV